MSELAMPEYVRHPLLEEFSYGKQGSFESLIKHSLPAGALPYEHEIHVLLPNYYMVGEKYPTVYFHDGPDYIRFGLVPHLMNELVEAKKIKPFLAVFVTPPNLHQSSTPNRSTEYGLNDNYVKFFCDELMTFVDKNYRTINLPESRLVVGDSYAGLISFYIAFSRPDSFANAYSQSGYFSFNNDQIIKLFRSVDRKKIKLYFDVGTYETKVGADFLPATELDFTNANRRMQDVLIMKNYNFCYNEYHEGHTWGNWRRHLIDAFQFFLGKE
ncbi:MAG: esterase family protein [Ignavibacteriaceae bacterium]|nr:esterase family protein [Ignavibacteriaceae bacterium]